MHRLPAALGPPRHRTVQGPVDLAHARPVPVAGEGTAISGGQRVTRHVEQLARRHVEHDGPGRWQVVQALHQAARLDPPAHGGQLGDEGVDDGGTPALRHGPAVVVGQGGEEPGEDARERRREGQHGVGGRAGHQRPPLLGAEPSGQVPGRRQPAQREAGRGKRMGGHVAHGAQEGWQDLVEVAHEGPEEPGVRPAVRAQGTGRVGNVGSDGHGARPSEGMGEGEGRREQADPVGGEIDVAEGGRGQKERVHRGADVVEVPREGQGCGAAAATGLVGRFPDVDRQAAAGQGQRGNQPIGASAHHDGIGAPHRRITV